MSILIDTLLKTHGDDRMRVSDCIKGRWYISKPLDRPRWGTAFVRRVQDALRVLRGRSFAVHYARDERTEDLPAWNEEAPGFPPSMRVRK